MSKLALSALRRPTLAVILLLTIALAACAAPAASTGESATAPTAEIAASENASESGAATRDVLYVGVQGLPGGMDPANELSNVGSRVTYSVFDMLLHRDFLDNNKLVPGLATSWERTSDTVMRLELREGVTFHNGDPFTAADVKFTYDRLRAPDTALTEAAGYFASFKEVRIIDDYTVEIETHEPDPLLEQRLASWGSWIVPQNYIESVGGDAEFALAAIGTGPYKVVSFDPDNELVLEVYEGYWDELPPVKQVIFRVIPEPSTRVTALLNGEVQIITNIPPDQVSTLEDADNVDLKQIPLANMHVLRYNTNHPVLSDPKLRQAMNLAIDRQLLIDTLWGGKAVALRGHQFEEYGDLYNAERPFVPYDPEAARQLVEESSYDGSVIEYATDANYYTNGLQAGQAIIEMWREVGINAEIRLTQPDESIPAKERMVSNWSNSSILADPDGALWRGWGEGSPTQRDAWPAPEEFNQLGLEARSTLDKEVRYDNYQRMLDIWEEEAPGTVLYIPVENYAMASDVNWEPYPFYYMDLRAYNLSFD
jgi:peptide/nickel transport system substrate-binding protein